MSAPTRTPWITLTLIGTNILAGFALLWRPDWIQELGFRAHEPSLLSAFASLFLHINVLHLLGNMLFLAAVGPWVEEAVGPWRYLIVYFVGGLLGCAAHAAMLGRSGTTEPLIGASGCVASCLGYASVRYASARVPLAPRLMAPVWAVSGVWVALQAAGGLVQVGGSGGGVAFWSHLGGLMAGVLLSLGFRAPQTASAKDAQRTLQEMAARGPAASLAAAERHLQSHPDDVSALRQKAEAHRLLSEFGPEMQTHRRLVEIGPPEDVGPSIVRLGEMGLLDQMAPRLRLRLASQLEATDADAARLLLRSVIDGSDDDQRPEALLALAVLERSGRPEVACALVRTLFDQYPMHPAADLARARGFSG